MDQNIILPILRQIKLQALRNRVQGPNETVHKYTKAITEMCSLMEIGKEERLNTYILGLWPEIRYEVAKAKPATLDKAEDRAQEVEKLRVDICDAASSLEIKRYLLQIYVQHIVLLNPILERVEITKSDDNVLVVILF